MKHLRAIITIGTLLALITLALWQSRTFFLQNKVTFLINQKRFDEATVLVEKLVKNDPLDPRTLALRVKVMTLMGDYKGAVGQDINDSVINDSPQVLYWLALARWQLSNDILAKKLAQRYIATNDTLPDHASMLVVHYLAGETELLPEPTAQSRGFRLLFSLEQAVYYGAAADQQFRLRRVESAAGLYKSAFNLGNRNRGTLLNGAEAAAIVGDSTLADLLLAFSGSDSVLPLYSKLLNEYDDFKSAGRTIYDQDIAGRGGRVDLARALSWAATVLLTENVSSNMYRVLRAMAELQQEYPYDRIVTTRLAVVLEILHRYDEAYAIYKKLYQEGPTLVIALRMWALEALPESEITTQINRFMADIATVDTVTANRLTGAHFDHKQEYILFYQSGKAAARLNVAEAGAYTLTVIAKGDEANGEWPLVRMTVDDQLIGYKYIRRESWDCYSIDLVLEAGSHEVLLEYVNGETPPANITELRTLSIRSIYLTKPGAA